MTSKYNLKEFNKLYKLLEIPKNCPGISWREGNSDGNFDLELIGLLQALNKLNYLHTTGSCAGHNLKEIEKEHKGWLVASPYRITLTIHVQINHIDNFSKLVNKLYEVSGGSFWCELGYQDDLNNRVEKDYLPFHIVVFANNKRRRDSLMLKYKSIVTDATQS